jgi:hypothetical protein
MDDNKICTLCLKSLPIGEFYESAGYKGGFTARCKNCTKRKSKERADMIKSTPSGIESERKRHRDKYYRLNYGHKYKTSRKSKRKSISSYNERYPEKYKAKIKSSRIKRSSKDNELHHWSYNEEHHKDVIELNHSLHAFIHRYIKYDQERMMYRDLSGVLLDSKTSHEAYIYTLVNAWKTEILERGDSIGEIN